MEDIFRQNQLSCKGGIFVSFHVKTEKIYYIIEYIEYFLLFKTSLVFFLLFIMCKFIYDWNITLLKAIYFFFS